WKPNLYLSFERERTQPSIDLMTRINLDKPYRIIDIGCGPGNSTNILKLRWPEAELIGLDDSEAMIQQAKEKYKDIKWVLADATGDLSSLGTFDIVFSNAAIQWMPNHPALIKNMFKLLNKGGVLAVQVPYTEEMPIHTDLQKLITRP
ncbi:MAG: methyltransferase domain-containing protein, partial [Eubacteriales bacterium]